MLGTRVVIKRGSKDQAEKPFWISFSDLMTALMVLFLLVMSVALLAVTKTVTEAERLKAERDRDIETLLTKVEKAAAKYPGVYFDRSRHVIDFREQALFATDSSQLTVQQAKELRAFVPEMLDIARDKLGRDWLKRLVVEGYASHTGTYLHNLNLSLKRSQRLLCVLLDSPLPDEKRRLSDAERKQIQELFLVGGNSFNAAKESSEQSQRIQLRLEFYGVEEKHRAADSITTGQVEKCEIEGK